MSGRAWVSTRIWIASALAVAAVGCKAKQDEPKAAVPVVPADAPVAPAPAPDAAAAAAATEVPALPADAKTLTGDQRLSPDATAVRYEWKAGAETIKLGVIVADAALTVVGPRDGKDAVLITERELNSARTTQLRVRPGADGLAILLVQDWSEGGTSASLDFAYLLAWDGKAVQVKQATVEELVTPPAWAKPD